MDDTRKCVNSSANMDVTERYLRFCKAVRRKLLPEYLKVGAMLMMESVSQNRSDVTWRVFGAEV